jgi:tRNA(fMet)-specific endonuclease VapC
LSVIEIVYGFHRKGREDRIAQFRTLISNHEVLGLDVPTAITAGRIYAELETHGTPVGLTDIMVAAIAIHHRLPIVTGNVRHFRAIDAAGHPLDIQNWREQTP